MSFHGLTGESIIIHLSNTLFGLGGLALTRNTMSQKRNVKAGKPN
jgi:hypothetical protein